MRKFFSSKESQDKQREKNCLRNRHSRRLKRNGILKGLKPEIDRISAASKLAELLATQVEHR